MGETDFIAIAIADEEHRQGRPYLADPDHCARCAEIDALWAQAVCEHDDYVELRELCSPISTRLCQDCGAVTEVVADDQP